MARIRFPILLALAAIPLLLSTAAAQNVTYTFSTPDTTIGCGEMLTMDVMIDSAITDLLGFSLVLSYDPLLFLPTSAAPGSLASGAPCAPFFSWLNSGSNDGTVRVDLAMLGCTLNGSGSILTVQFQGLESGASIFSAPLGLSGSMRDGGNEPIVFVASPASLSSNCNNAPLAVSDADSTSEDTGITTLNVLTNDSDPDGDDFNLSSFDAVSAAGGSVSYNGDGTFGYMPFPDFHGADSFSYAIFDGDLADTAVVLIHVDDVNDPPAALPDSTSTVEDTPVDVDVLANDSDIDGTLDPGSVLVTSGPSSGQVAVNPTTGVITYVPDLEFSGLDTLTYVVEDDDGAASNPAAVWIAVAGQNDPPVVLNPGDQNNLELDSVSLQLQVSDGDAGDSHTFAAAGLPPGLSVNPGSGLLSGTIGCGAATASPYACAVSVADNGSPPETTQVSFNWTVTALPTPTAPIGLIATRRVSGNDADGTTAIDLTWTPSGGGGNSVQVYRKAFGDYPEYDDGAGTVPTLPATPAAAIVEGWTLTVVDAPGEADAPVIRDFWYYVAFAINGCGSASPPSSMTSGTLNYHLGDVVPGPGYGNNLVNLFDISKLGNHYGTTEGDAFYVDTLDVGPTTDLSVTARPSTDNQIQFEDLVLFAIQFNEVSAPEVMPLAASLSRNAVTAWLPSGSPAIGSTFEVPVDLSFDGSIRAASISLRHDNQVVELVSQEPGEFISQGDGHIVLLSPGPGTLDLAGFRGPLSGEGTLARLSFRVIGPGDPGIRLDAVLARDDGNRPIPVEADVRSGERIEPKRPLSTRLLGGFPNPFRSSTSIRLELAADGPVSVQIFGIDGRLVRTLVDETRPPGSYDVEWDGRDDAGRQQAANVFLVRMSTGGSSSTIRLIQLR